MVELKAFTLLEMIVVMLLSGIAVSSGWLVQNYIQESLISRSLNAQETLREMEYIADIRKNWDRAKIIQSSDQNQIQLLGSDFEIIYSFEEGLVTKETREPEVQLQYFEFNHTDHHIHTIDKDTRKLINQWSFLFYFHGKEIPIYLTKTYETKTLIQFTSEG